MKVDSHNQRNDGRWVSLEVLFLLSQSRVWLTIMSDSVKARRSTQTVRVPWLFCLLVKRLPVCPAPPPPLPHFGNVLFLAIIVGTPEYRFNEMPCTQMQSELWNAELELSLWYAWVGSSLPVRSKRAGSFIAFMASIAKWNGCSQEHFPLLCWPALRLRCLD